MTTVRYLKDQSSCFYINLQHLSCLILNLKYLASFCDEVEAILNSFSPLSAQLPELFVSSRLLFTLTSHANPSLHCL